MCYNLYRHLTIRFLKGEIIMRNFFDFLRHAQMINLGIIKYAIKASPSASEEILCSYEYLRQIRNAFWRNALSKNCGKTFTVHCAASSSTIRVNRLWFENVATEHGFVVIDCKYNSIFTLMSCKN